MLIFAFIFSAALAWETDNFTCRHRELADSAAAMSAEVNRRFQEVVTVGAPSNRKASHIELQRQIVNSGIDSLSVNDRQIVTEEVNAFMAARGIADFSEGLTRWSSSPGLPQPLTGCNRTELLNVLRGAIASPFIGTIGDWAGGSDLVAKCESSGVGIYSGFPMVANAAIQVVGLSPTIRIGSSYIGTDKIEHFMTEGFEYYQKQLEGGTLEEILAIGAAEENTLYGLMASGVKSYGDLAANYSGYLFWKNVLDGENPYFRCVEGRWQQARQFNWNEYVNPMWDESINCSDYLTEPMRATVARNVRELLAQSSSLAQSCPVLPAQCARAREWITSAVVRAQVISPVCLSVSPQAPGESVEEASGVAR